MTYLGTNAEPIIIKKVRPADQVMEWVKRYIADNDLRPGDMLPSEAELADMLHVGRRIVREALKSLEAMDIVDLKVGKGIYVADFNFHKISRHMLFSLARCESGMDSLLEARVALETAALDILIDKIDDEGLQHLREVAEGFQRASDMKGHIAADLSFHKALVEMTGNPFLIQFFIVIDRFFTNAFLNKPLSDEDRCHLLNPEGHMAIVEAIATRDRERVRMAAICRHMCVGDGPLAADCTPATCTSPRLVVYRRRFEEKEGSQ